MMLIRASFASCLQAEKRSASVLYLQSIVCFVCDHCCFGKAFIFYMVALAFKCEQVAMKGHVN